MRCSGFLSLALLVVAVPATAATPTSRLIDFPCTRNLTDGRVLVDGTQWDEKMRALGYTLENGSYVPYEVLKFTQQKVDDATWAEGICEMKLLPKAK